MEGEEQIDINEPCSSDYDSDDNHLVFDSSDGLILCALPNSFHEDDNIPFENLIPEGRGTSLDRLQSETHTLSQRNLKGTTLVFDPSTISRYYDMEEHWMLPMELRLTSTLSFLSDGSHHGTDPLRNDDRDRVLLVEDDLNILIAQNNFEDDDDGYDLIIEDVVSDDGEIISRRITQMTEEEMENKENIAVGMSSRTLPDDSDRREFTGSGSSPLHSR